MIIRNLNFATIIMIFIEKLNFENHFIFVEIPQYTTPQNNINDRIS